MKSNPIISNRLFRLVKVAAGFSANLQNPLTIIVKAASFATIAADDITTAMSFLYRWDCAKVASAKLNTTNNESCPF
jgi:hypothetical protein